MFHFDGDNEMYTDKPRNVGGYKTTFSDRPIHHIYIIIHPNAGFPASRNIRSKPEIRWGLWKADGFNSWILLVPNRGQRGTGINRRKSHMAHMIFLRKYIGHHRKYFSRCFWRAGSSMFWWFGWHVRHQGVGRLSWHGNDLGARLAQM